MNHSILIATLIFSISSIWAVQHIGLTKHLSVSLHVSQQKLTQVIFGTGIIVSSLLFAVGIFGWMLPHYGAVWYSRALFAGILLDFVLLAAVPHVRGTWREAVHNIAAWGMVALVPFAMLTTFFWPVSDIARAAIAILLGLNIILLTCSVTFKKMWQYFLFFQSAYMLNFFALLLILAYARG